MFGIQVGVSINIFVRRRDRTDSQAEIFYARVDETWRKEDKYHLLDSKSHCGNIEWRRITPDSRNSWLTEGLQPEFETFIEIGTKDTRAAEREDGEAIFALYSYGVVTSRDNLAYSFHEATLQERVRTFVEIYNRAVDRKRRQSHKSPIEEFIDTHDPHMKWSHRVKESLKNSILSNYEESHFRTGLYRPFTKKHLYFDHLWNERRYKQYRIFPLPFTQCENRVICVSGLGSNKPFQTLISDMIPSHDTLEKTQCFPFYRYDEDGTNRQENITNWAYRQFCDHYRDDTITKWSIFHYVYSILHHPDYRKRYLANLKRDLPRIPWAADFWIFADAGSRLAEIHVEYEQQPEYPLNRIEDPKEPLNWRVEKMKLSRDKKQIKYNDFLTLDGVPTKSFDYRLGNRSALEWVIDQYRVTTDTRSGIKSDPNRVDDEQYIVRLIGKVITVSLETVEIVEGLPELGIPDD